MKAASAIALVVFMILCLILLVAWMFDAALPSWLLTIVITGQVAAFIFSIWGFSLKGKDHHDDQ